MYETTEDIRIMGVIIPKGFTYDGASIPSILWGMLYTPFHPRVILPALYHDFMYRRATDRKIIDLAFYRLLVAAGVPRSKALTIYHGVRLFGGRYFRKHK